MILLAALTAHVAVANGPSPPAPVATLYVNKYFEVRGHDVPTKYVFHGETRVVRSTGGLSDNLRIQRLRLHRGWNLGALVVTATNVWTQLGVAGPSPVITAVFKWNDQLGEFQPLLEGDHTPAGAVLWLHASIGIVLSICGRVGESTNRSFSAAGAFISSQGFEPWHLKESLPGTASVWNWAPAKGQWEFHPGEPVVATRQAPDALPSGQAMFARNDTPFAAPSAPGSGSLLYYHQDHLGSSARITDGVGNLVAANALHPFGQRRIHSAPSSAADPYLFTQMERDAESGLDSFPVRYYQSSLGRFIQPDALHAHLDQADAAGELLSRPQKLNSYAYVRNNPANYTDPTGYDDEAPPQQESPPPPLPPVTRTILTLPPGYMPAEKGAPAISFQPITPNAGSGLTLPASAFDAAQQAEANRRALTGQPPDPPKAGSAGDVLKAVGKLQLNGKPLQDQAIGLVTGPALRDWKQASTGEKALVISAGVVMAGLAAPALQNKDAVSGLQAVVPKVAIPIPVGKGLEVNVSVSTSKPEGGITFGGRF